MIPLQGKRVTVMGLGLHGGALGNIKWLQEQGAKITVTDLKEEGELTATVQQLKEYPDIELVLGEHRMKDFTNADLILRNPAVPRNSEYLRAAKAAGVPIEMDSSLFFEYSLSQNIVGVTGSKGKTTCANAIHVLLKAKYPGAVAVGLDGISPLAAVGRTRPGTPVIFELSSWRLEALDQRAVSPRTAVITSLYQDHLNTYDSFNEYIETKETIIRHQNKNDQAILNADDPRVRTWAPQVKGKLFWFGMKPPADYDQLLLAKTEGIFVDNGTVIIKFNDRTEELFSLSLLPLTGEHEQRNLLPGILLAWLENIPVDTIKYYLSLIHRLPHRLEAVAKIKGVTYINDSAATMPDATIAALKTLAGRKLIHILGGSDKQLEFSELASTEAAADIRALIFLPGNATDRMKQKIEAAFATRPETYEASDMLGAVAKAHAIAQEGDVVLLSPAATSFGMFQHEFDRGDKFRQAVTKLPAT